MRIALLTFGSLGDVQPFVALAVRLKQAGYDVTLGAGEGFDGLAAERQIDFVPIHADLRALLQSDDYQHLLRANPIRKLRAIKRAFNKLFPPIIQEMLEQSWKAARDADGIVYHPNAFAGSHIAEKLAIPAFVAIQLPYLSPTRRFPDPRIRFRGSFGGLLNKLSYSLKRFPDHFQSSVEAWRTNVLQIPARPRRDSDLSVGSQRLSILYSFSPHVIRPPDDWDSAVAVTGFWFLDQLEDWEPPQRLDDFISAGPPPVYIGFGSMTSENPRLLTQKVIEALRLSGQRGVIATGWGAMESNETSKSVCAVQSVPHDWLFPRVSAVIHHGGAGTTATGLRFGKPTVVCPFSFDQPYWGHVVRSLGVGPSPIRLRRLNVRKLAEAIRRVASDERMRTRAREIGARIELEDGVGRAVEIISKRLAVEANRPSC